MELFAVEDLSFTYAGSDNVTLDHVNLSVEEGECLLLCGRSGCGKTTLLRQLKTVLAPQGHRSGRVIYDGMGLDQVSMRRQTQQIGFVLQDPADQIVTDRVWHELAFGLENLGYSQKEMQMRIAEMAHFFGIADWFYHDTASLSGGQKQLLNLASVMVLSPRVLILDEPTAQLDPVAAEDFFHILEKIRKELGTTIVMTEHRLESVCSLADRMVVLEAGHVLCQGSPGDVIRSLAGHPYFVSMPVVSQIATVLTPQEDKIPLNVWEARQYMKKYQTQFDPERAGQACAGDLPGVTEDPVLTAKGIWFRYTREGEDILREWKFSLPGGAVTCILGGNGCGKSTLLKVLAGTVRAYRGRVKTLAGIGLLPQDPQLLFVKDCVRDELLDTWQGDPGEELEQEELLQLLGIIPLLDRHPYDLSAGEQQRTALAKVLFTRPEILLLDEPTKGCDGYYRRQMGQILRTLQEQGMTILIVSHDMEFCGEYAQYCCMLFDGQTTGLEPARCFFADRSFYTTAARRMTKGYLEDAVTREDVIRSWR